MALFGGLGAVFFPSFSPSKHDGTVVFAYFFSKIVQDRQKSTLLGGLAPENRGKKGRFLPPFSPKTDLEPVKIRAKYRSEQKTEIGFSLLILVYALQWQNPCTSKASHEQLLRKRVDELFV